MDEIMITIISALVSFVIASIIGFKLGVIYRKKIAEAELGSAEEQAKKIVAEAVKTAEAKKREAIIEAKDEIFRIRNESEKELRERRGEIQRQERRLQQKEELLDKKVENLEKKEELLIKKHKEADDKIVEAEMIKSRQFDLLERISGYTAEQAKEYMLEVIDSQLQHEKALKISLFETQLKDQADQKAREYITNAIQRYAAEHVSEVCVSVVTLPNDEMKGRIIGREGRNIRTFETLTGVDLIIDDTPEAITLSTFDPVRREIARIALERLIADGRIHPARIEEMVEKSRREIEQIIKQEGERAIMETGVHGMHPDLVKLIGRLHYRSSYGQNILAHSLEVAFISGMLASELGVNQLVARRAGLLHDIGKAIDHEVEGSHVDIGVEIARKYKENNEIIHAIEAHHRDVEPSTIIACLVQAADAISAARPGARRENIESYIKRLEKLEEIANLFEGVEKSFAIQAGREIRILVKPEAVSDDEIVIMAHNIVNKIESELDYPGQIKVHVIRENRAIEYAK